MINPKTTEQVRQEIYTALPPDLKNMYDAGKAKALVDAFSEQIGDFYEAFDENVRQVSLSTATGAYLDFIGRSYGVPRLFNESDDLYRLRIQNNILTQQTGNATSIDSLLRSHPRVKDLKYVDYVYGAGSFAIFVITSDDSIADGAFLQELQGMVNVVKSRGTKALVLAPTYVPMTISAILTIPAGEDADMLRTSVSEALYKYIWNLDIGETLYIDELRAVAVNLGAKGITFASITLDGKRVLIRDYNAAWDEKIIPDPSLAKSISIN